MTPILDQVAAEWRSDFHPASPIEFFALRLASRLGEPQTARHFALLASEHGVQRLLAVFQRTIAVTKAGESIARRFHQELLTTGRNGMQVPSVRLAGIRVERRSIGAAMFQD